MYHLTNDGAVTVIAGQITFLQTHFSFGAFETGLLSGAALLVTAIFQMVFGAMSDRRDPNRFLPLGIVVLGLGSALVSLSSTFWILLLLVSLSRIGASFYHPVGIAWIGREFQGPELDRSMGFQSAFGDTGVILGMATTSVIAVAFGWQVPFLLWGGINLGAVALGLWLVRNHRASTGPRESPNRDYIQMIRDVRLWLFWPLGSAVFITYPALFSFVSEASHRRLQGAAFGLIFGFQLLGGSLGSFAAGSLAASFRTSGDFESTGPFYFLGFLALAGFV